MACQENCTLLYGQTRRKRARHISDITAEMRSKVKFDYLVVTPNTIMANIYDHNFLKLIS